jgi:hypothetical protein
LTGKQKQVPRDDGTRRDHDREKSKHRPEIRGVKRRVGGVQGEIHSQGKIFRQKDERERDGPLPTTYGTAATMFLLLLHLLQNCLLLDLDQIPAFLLAQTKPKLLDALPLFSRGCAPDFVVFGWLVAGRSILPAFVWARSVRGRRRWVVMGRIMRVVCG